MEQTGDSGIDLVYIVLISFGVALAASIVMLVWVIYQVERIELPPDAGFLTTLRATPLSVVILLDLLDFSLDFLSAPAAWFLLSWLGLKPLRWVAVIEGVLPFTHLLPTMTLVWIVAKLSEPE
jgi:hypothetical protein